MGQDQSAQLKTQQYKQFLLQYSQEKEHSHPQFGAIKLYTHIQTNELICVKTLHTKCDAELNQIQEHFNFRNTFEQNNLLRILAVKKQDQVKICSNQSSITIVIQCYLETLADEIKIRKNNNKPYSEGHLWILLQQIIDPCAYLEERNCSHGDIKPSTIYLDENGSVKLAEFDLVKGGQSGFEKMMQSKDKAYLSPLLLQQYHSMAFSPQHNPYKSDVYSLGLTMLSVILLEEVYDCYDFLNGQMLQNILEEKLVRIWTMGYSQILIQFIRQLLLQDESERASWLQLKEFIDKYRDKIYNMVPFYQQPLTQKSNNQSKSPFKANVMYLPIRSPKSQPQYCSQQFNTSRSESKPKYIHISKENY